MIKETKIEEIYLQNIVCDKCGEIMQSTEVLTSYPPQYVYRCKKCENKIVSFESFPKYRFVYGESKIVNNS